MFRVFNSTIRFPKGNPMATRDEMIAAIRSCAAWGVADLERKPVKSARFGLVYVREMGNDEKDAWEDTNHAKNAEGDLVFSRVGYRARLLQRTVCDASGQLLFTEADLPMLGALPGRETDKILKLAMSLNAVTEQDIRDLEKNSAAAPAAASS
jgi:hypothetical protein